MVMWNDTRQKFKIFLIGLLRNFLLDVIYSHYSYSLFKGSARSYIKIDLQFILL